MSVEVNTVHTKAGMGKIIKSGLEWSLIALDFGFKTESAELRECVFTHKYRLAVNDERYIIGT